MMTHKLATTCFVIGATLAPLAAHAADSEMDRGHPAAFVKDSVITTKVKAKLAAERLDSLKHIRVDTDASGIVTLSGTVNSRDEEQKAITLARNTEGVKSVMSDLRVQKDR
ncbi:MAG: BON domain-containing protein [Betaproteobacteria bacterium]|nr:BON domain-containing protein [Betaproteobacteria bacterium]MDE2359465.1 BON domain-containing protein [Betaproteobacteria bacterium]